MGFKRISLDLAVSLVLFLKRSVLLIFLPYQTMRQIVKDTSMLEIALILLLTFFYFWYSSFLKTNSSPFFISYISFLIFYFLTISYFGFFTFIFTKKLHVRALIYTFSYALVPTLVWFVTTSFFYYFLPPPRTMSFFGTSFSILFLSFSISLFIWKIILLFLAIRFATHFTFYKIIYLLVIYGCIFFPACLFFYQIGVFRVPFV